MCKDNVVQLSNRALIASESRSALEAILCEGACKMLQATIRDSSAQHLVNRFLKD